MKRNEEEKAAPCCQGGDKMKASSGWRLRVRNVIRVVSAHKKTPKKNPQVSDKFYFEDSSGRAVGNSEKYDCGDRMMLEAAGEAYGIVPKARYVRGHKVLIYTLPNSAARLQIQMEAETAGGLGDEEDLNSCLASSTVEVSAETPNGTKASKDTARSNATVQEVNVKEDVRKEFKKEKGQKIVNGRTLTVQKKKDLAENKDRMNIAASKADDQRSQLASPTNHLGYIAQKMSPIKQKNLIATNAKASGVAPKNDAPNNAGAIRRSSSPATRIDAGKAARPIAQFPGTPPVRDKMNKAGTNKSSVMDHSLQTRIDAGKRAQPDAQSQGKQPNKDVPNKNLIHRGFLPPADLPSKPKYISSRPKSQGHDLSSSPVTVMCSGQTGVPDDTERRDPDEGREPREKRDSLFDSPKPQPAVPEELMSNMYFGPKPLRFSWSAE